MEQHFIPQALQPNTITNRSYSRFARLENWLEAHLGPQGPVQLPEAWKEGLPRYAAWVTLAFLPILAFSGVLSGLVTILTIPVAAMGGPLEVMHTLGSTAFNISTIALMGMSIPGLFRRQKNGWVFMFYAVLVSFTADAVRLDLLGLAVDAFWCFMLFQTKHKYHSA